MRLLRIRLRDFRGVHDREVHLAESGVTVLEGENEVGKTSTVVALDLLIDFRDDSKAAPVRSAAPAGRDAGPEVEAEFVTGPYHVVYRKRWLRRRLTELHVTGPTTEQLAGREAHDRLLAILDETMDRDLWLALRVEQHTPLGQVDLGGHDALTRALDRAAGGEAVGPAADAAAEGLVERALAEVRRYHGGHGRPVGPLREAGDRVAAARAEADAAAAALSEVERDVDLRAELDREATGLAEERRAQNARVRELEDRWSALQARQQEVATSAERAEAARERASRATERQDTRATLVAAAAAAEQRADRARETLGGLEAGDRARREDLAERRAEADRALAASDAATAAARTAAAALAVARDRSELADLRGRLRRAETAEDARREAARAADGPCADAAAVDRLEGLDRAVVQAEAELAAGAATVEVTGLGDRTEVAVDGDLREVADGETTTLPVADAVTIDVPGAVRMTVRPGLDGEAARRRVTDARTARDQACTALGVADVAAARTALRTAGEAAARVRELAAVVERELGGRALEDVRGAIAALAGRIPSNAPDGPDAAPARRRGPRRAAPDEPGLFEEAGLLDDASADPEPEDLEPLRLEAVRTLDAADEAHRTARAAEEAWRRLDASVSAAGTEVVAARTALAVARNEADRRSGELRDARAEHPDDTLAAAATDALARARRYEADHEQRAAALEADDPTTVEALYATAKRAVESLTQRTADVERRRAEVTGRLQVAGGEGRHDRHAAARTELAAAEREHSSVSRRAAAAVRLHDTLARRRDEVRRAYVAPFRREVERLARIVFGPSLALEVDPALRIVSRTLNGVTVPFDALSTGAKEQLGLCARLAVAALVDAEDGVPVLIDDALGHSDPGRLERLAAVFGAAAAGSSHQVVVLTCTPARYRGIGATRTVTLNPSYPPPQAVAAADGDREDARDDERADVEAFRAG
ncbi:hypothetical protein [Actinomycetospora sp. CA-084318]|uniref:ATP-binding protein n=1 Tax=Actinomycetospora sp. CA-084318 TaxID=3239892 RepID=UPI003D956EE5